MNIASRYSRRSSSASRDQGDDSSVILGVIGAWSTSARSARAHCCTNSRALKCESYTSYRAIRCFATWPLYHTDTSYPSAWGCTRAVPCPRSNSCCAWYVHRACSQYSAGHSGLCASPGGKPVPNIGLSEKASASSQPSRSMSSTFHAPELSSERLTTHSSTCQGAASTSRTSKSLSPYGVIAKRSGGSMSAWSAVDGSKKLTSLTRRYSAQSSHVRLLRDQGLATGRDSTVGGASAIRTDATPTVL